MSTATMFDTLAYAKKLKATGFTEEQAEVQAQAIVELIDEKLATKKDLEGVEVALKRDIKDVEIGLRRDIKDVEIRLKRDIEEVEERVMYKLTMRLGSMFVAGFSVLAMLIKVH